MLAEVTTWQARPLEPMHPLVFVAALWVKIRKETVRRHKATYLALRILPDGTRDILGLYLENTECTEVWMKVFNGLNTRGVTDILIAVTGGLQGISEALGAVFPATKLKTCTVHLIRNNLDCANWQDRKLLVKDLRPVCTTLGSEAAAQALDEFQRSAWDRVIPFFRFPPELRRVAYMTHSIESVHNKQAAQDHQGTRTRLK